MEFYEGMAWIDKERLGAIERDAARYQWLRSQRGSCHITQGPTWDMTHLSYAKADETIDREMHDKVFYK